MERIVWHSLHWLKWHLFTFLVVIALTKLNGQLWCFIADFKHILSFWVCYCMLSVMQEWSLKRHWVVVQYGSPEFFVCVACVLHQHLMRDMFKYLLLFSVIAQEVLTHCKRFFLIEPSLYLVALYVRVESRFDGAAFSKKNSNLSFFLKMFCYRLLLQRYGACHWKFFALPHLQENRVKTCMGHCSFSSFAPNDDI